MDNLNITEENLQAYVKYWQKRLNLENWKIMVNFYREHDFEHPRCRGENSYNITTGESLIKILDPQDYPKGTFEQNIEKTLVHELLHLHFAPFEPEENLAHDLWERCIVEMATALTAAPSKVKY